MGKTGKAARSCWTAYPRRTVLLPATLGVLVFVLLGVVGGVLLSTCWFVLILALQLYATWSPMTHFLEGGNHRTVLITHSVSYGLLGFMAFIGLCVNASTTSGIYAFDSALSGIVAISISAVATSTLLVIFSDSSSSDVEEGTTTSSSIDVKPKTPKIPCRKCCSCCSYCTLLFLYLLTGMATWHACMKASQPPSTAPGDRIRVKDGPAMHIYCEGSNDNLPTVVSLNGIYGSSLDSVWIRRHPLVVSSKVRFCSIDRPGAGWSEPWPSAVDFGQVARYTREALEAAKSAGKAGRDLVLLMHSLGGYHGLALAKELAHANELRIVGAVSADAMSPSWGRWDMPRPAAECSPTLQPSCSGWRECSFWRLVRLVEPTGIVRLLYVSGVGGFDTSVRALPEDIQATYLANAMKPSYLDYILTEGSAWGRNCGFAKLGESELTNPSVKRFEVVVVPDGVNLTALVGATHLDVLPYNCRPSGQTGPSCHQSVVLDSAVSDHTAKALMRVVNAAA